MLRERLGNDNQRHAWTAQIYLNPRVSSYSGLRIDAEIHRLVAQADCRQALPSRPYDRCVRPETVQIIKG